MGKHLLFPAHHLLQCIFVADLIQDELFFFSSVYKARNHLLTLASVETQYFPPQLPKALTHQRLSVRCLLLVGAFSCVVLVVQIALALACLSGGCSCCVICDYEKVQRHALCQCD